MVFQAINDHFNAVGTKLLRRMIEKIANLHLLHVGRNAVETGVPSHQYPLKAAIQKLGTH